MDDERSPIQFHLVLHRIEPGQGIRRVYSLMIEPDLFGTVRLVRNWGRIGTKGRSWRRSMPTNSRQDRR
jgi:predicted DNA-binding WGR domain protein